MSGTIADAPPPLATVIPSYAYQEYSDDINIQAFIASFNTLAQSYLDWFNGNPLGVYVNPNIAGLLLDWCATGIYGIPRPVLSSLSTKYIAGLNSAPLNARALDGNTYLQSGTATNASDDVYKRVLTWWLYRGDGQQFSIGWLRRRVARFIYGANGTDISLNYLQNIGITVSSGTYTINVPSGASSQYFQQCAANGVLALPFQNTFSIVVA
jgi:hypothetical protein